MWSRFQNLARAGTPALSLCVVLVHSAENASAKTKQDARVVIVGGGSGGVGVAAMLCNEGFKHVTVVEPNDTHYYQPLWTLVAAGMKTAEGSARPMKDVITKKANWVKKSAVKMDPDNNSVVLSDGSKLTYDYLIVAAGLKLNYDAVPGMQEAIDDENSGVVSTYTYKYAEKTWKEMQNFNGGRAIFTMPNTVLKCPGAPQKIMWLFEENMRDWGRRDKTSVEFWVPGPAMFGVPKYSEKLTDLANERNIDRHFKSSLISVDGKGKMATFKNADTGAITSEKYDFLHVIPAQTAPDFIRDSKLANEAGFVDVDQKTLQSVKYPNVFGIGDCTSTPNSKTAAAITKQAPILVHNLERVVDGQKPDAWYNGYASCPLVVGKKQTILAEFGYGGKIMETFNPETGVFPYYMIGQEGFGRPYFFTWMKADMFPYVYWNLWTKGEWFGASGPFKPNLRTKPKGE